MKKTASKIVFRFGTSDDSAKVASTIGTAPRSPAQPSSSRSRLVNLLKAVDAQTAAGLIASMSRNASATAGTATSSSRLGKTSRPRTMKSATWARNARPSWKATSWRR